MIRVKCNLIIIGFLAQMPYTTTLNTDYKWWKQKASSFKGLLDRRNSTHMDSVVIEVMFITRMYSVIMAVSLSSGSHST